MFCHKCGQELPEGAKFCASCGECIVKEENKKENTHKKNPFKKALKVFLIVVGVLFLLAIVGKIIENIVGFETPNSDEGQSGSEIVDSANEEFCLVDEMYGTWYVYGGDEHCIIVEKDGELILEDGSDALTMNWTCLSQTSFSAQMPDGEGSFEFIYSCEQLIRYNMEDEEEIYIYVKDSQFVDDETIEYAKRRLVEERNKDGSFVYIYDDEGRLIRLDNYDEKQTLEDTCIYEFDREEDDIEYYKGIFYDADLNESDKEEYLYEGYDVNTKLLLERQYYIKGEWHSTQTFYYDLKGNMIQTSAIDRSGFSYISRRQYDEEGVLMAELDIGITYEKQRDGNKICLHAKRDGEYTGSVYYYEQIDSQTN